MSSLDKKVSLYLFLSLYRSSRRTLLPFLHKKMKLIRSESLHRIPFLLLSSLVVLLISQQQSSLVSAVRSGDFKQCQDSSFCRRIRRLSDYVDSKSNFKSPYSFKQQRPEPTFHSSNSTLVLALHSAIHPNVEFQLQFHFHKDGSSRVKMDQIGEKHNGWRRYDEASLWAIHNQPQLQDGEGNVDCQTAAGVTTVR